MINAIVALNNSVNNHLNRVVNFTSSCSASPQSKLDMVYNIGIELQSILNFKHSVKIGNINKCITFHIMINAETEMTTIVRENDDD